MGDNEAPSLQIVKVGKDEPNVEWLCPIDSQLNWAPFKRRTLGIVFVALTGTLV